MKNKFHARRKNLKRFFCWLSWGKNSKDLKKKEGNRKKWISSWYVFLKRWERKPLFCRATRNIHFSIFHHRWSILRKKKMLLMHLTPSDEKQEYKALKRGRSFFYANSFETLNIYLIAGVWKQLLPLLLPRVSFIYKSRKRW